MIPNFKGCYQYNPSSNPLKGLSKEDKEQFAFEYMQMWVNTEGFDDFNIMFDSGDAELMADALVGAGAINSKLCFESCREIESIIESWAKAFRKLSDKQRQKRYDKAFKECMIVKCNECNHVQFPERCNFELYKSELTKACWECSSTNIEIREWK
jgi:ribosomal protein L32